jgi:TRAP-type C4-dicarboxylate transport system permease large subunit
VVYESGFQYTLSVVPLFILMGNFVTRAGMSKELYRAGHTVVGHLRGGLAMATVLACAGFGAICGSSIATAATMTKVAYPSMSDHHYSDELAVGTIAAGGTLGILIPPSTIMVIYGIMTNTSIGKLFAAGILPGSSRWCCSASRCSTSAGATRERAEGRAAQLARALRRVQGRLGGRRALRHRHGRDLRRRLHRDRGRGHRRLRRLLLRAGAGALSPRALLDVLIESSRTTAMLFMILVGALIFANFINYTTMPADLRRFVTTTRSIR